MWKYNGRIIRPGKAWVAGGITHPANWAIWTDDYKVSMGLVWEADPAPYDNRFFWDANTPKALDDIPQVDSDNNPILDEDGVQMVAEGLKTVWKRNTKQTAGSMLAPTDWHVVKATEVAEYSVPTEIAQWRQSVRTASNTIEAAIDAAADHAAFIALWDAPVDADGVATGNAPIHDWPKEL